MSPEAPDPTRNKGVATRHPSMLYPGSQRRSRLPFHARWQNKGGREESSLVKMVFCGRDAGGCEPSLLCLRHSYKRSQGLEGRLALSFTLHISNNN